MRTKITICGLIIILMIALISCSSPSIEEVEKPDIKLDLSDETFTKHKSTTTGSMLYTIRDNMNITYRFVDENTPLIIGDIIRYRKKGQLILHRIIDIRNGTYITKGDHNSYVDDPVLRKNIIAKVVKLEYFD